MQHRIKHYLSSLLWSAAAAAVLALMALAALSVVEYTRLGWLTSDPPDLVFVSVAAASGALGLTAVARVLWKAWRGGIAIGRTLSAQSTAATPGLTAAAHEFAVADRLGVVRTEEAFALTHGLLRPRIMVSTALISTLTPVELRAVLAHEARHLRRRDPLRLLAARLLAGYAWYLPAAGWLAERFALRRELAADRDAARRCGVGALASALVKLAQPPAAFASAPAVNPRGRLEARISQLEGGKVTGRPRLAARYLAATLGNGAVLGASALCCIGLSTALPGGML
jgi:Zn-dependent protease with chaperone function